MVTATLYVGDNLNDYTMLRKRWQFVARISEMADKAPEADFESPEVERELRFRYVTHCPPLPPR